MSRYSGPQDYREGKPSQVARRRKREEAIERNARTPRERRRWVREGRPESGSTRRAAT